MLRGHRAAVHLPKQLRSYVRHAASAGVTGFSLCLLHSHGCASHTGMPTSESTLCLYAPLLAWLLNRISDTLLLRQDEEIQAPASPHAIMEDLRAAEEASQEARQALSSPRRQSPRRSASASAQAPQAHTPPQELPSRPAPGSAAASATVSPRAAAQSAPAQQQPVPGPGPIPASVPAPAAPPAAETSFFGLDDDRPASQLPSGVPSHADLMHGFEPSADDLFAAPAAPPASTSHRGGAVDSWDIFNQPSQPASQVSPLTGQAAVRKPAEPCIDSKVPALSRACAASGIASNMTDKVSSIRCA